MTNTDTTTTARIERLLSNALNRAEADLLTIVERGSRISAQDLAQWRSSAEMALKAEANIEMLSHLLRLAQSIDDDVPVEQARLWLMTELLRDSVRPRPFGSSLDVADIHKASDIITSTRIDS